MWLVIYDLINNLVDANQGSFISTFHEIRFDEILLLDWDKDNQIQKLQTTTRQVTNVNTKKKWIIKVSRDLL